MRRILDAAYLGAGLLAGVFLVAIAVLVVGQIVFRLLGMIIPSADEFAGYCLSATSFLALAWTLRSGGHIRVTLFLQRAGGGLRRLLEALNLGVAAAMMTYFAWFTVQMVWESWSAGEVTSGLVPLPLWLPQTGMAVGVVLLAAALLEGFVDALLGRRPVEGDGPPGRGLSEPSL